MKFYTKYLMIIIMSFFILPAFAQTPATIADVKSDVISNLQKDGYLSEKMANEVAQKYITTEDVNTKIYINKNNDSSFDSKNQPINNSDNVGVSGAQQASSTINWTQYVSWINFIKVVGCILLIIAFWGFIKIIIKSTWHIITAVPAIIYQILFLALSLYGTFFPEQIWESQYFYIALICSFTNLLILGWIAFTYKIIIYYLSKFFNFGIPMSTIGSFWAMIYFGTLAVAYESSIFGFFSAIALSGIFTFTIMYSPGILFLHFKENALAAVVFGHILILVAYVGIYHSGIAQPYIQHFNAGIQYYCTIALGVGLLVGSSPFYKPSQALAYFLLFIMIVVAATVLYFFLSMTTIATILFIFFILVFAEWIGYVGFKTGWVVGCAVLGAMLYGFSLLLESYGPMILNNIKSVMI